MACMQDSTFTVNWEYNALDFGREKMTRKRYLELTKIGKDVCEFLEKRGVKKEEGCKLRYIIDKLWELNK